MNHHRICNKSSAKGATTGVGTAHPFGALQFTLSEHFSSPIVCSGVHVARSLFFCVVFCGSVCSIVLFLLTIVLPVPLRFASFD